MVEDLAGVAIDQGEAEMGGPRTQAVQHALLVGGVVGGGPGVLVQQAVLERAVDEIASLRAVAGMALALPTR